MGGGEERRVVVQTAKSPLLAQRTREKWGTQPENQNQVKVKVPTLSHKMREGWGTRGAAG